MSLDADALKEMAANRGLKLRRSRVRSPDKKGFNKFGLVDASDTEVFGFKRGKPAAEPEEIADYLRSAEVQVWKESLKGLGLSKVKRSPSPSGEVSPKATERSQASESTPPSALRAATFPKGEELRVREAKKGDADQLVTLFALLDHAIEAKTVAANLKALEKAGEPVIVASRGKQLLGACGIHRTLNPHRDKPVGRITILVVAKDARDQGIGRMLVEEAERRLTNLGCGLIEVTSNDRLAEAHAFYRHLGYERTSMRFAKTLPSG